jgi:micrococcal nuclease
MSLLLLAAVALSGCAVVDGDTIRCGQERIRLLGIDAPEMHGCPKGRRCAPGDPQASTDNLRRLVEGQSLRIERVGQDRYGRTLAVVWAGGVNTSCAQVAGGFAIYRPDWDNGGRVAQSC